MFVDETAIRVKAGDYGRGGVSFRREKYEAPQREKARKARRGKTGFVFALGISLLLGVIVRAQDVDPSTLNGKALLGYQGWFYTPSDGAGKGWKHWTKNSVTPTASSLAIDGYPDLTEMSPAELTVVPGMTIGGSQPAYLYSSYTRSIVLRHFDWMQQYGLDGILVQRFVVDSSFMRSQGDVVLKHIMDGAAASGRVFAIEYDISGANGTTLVNDLQQDWLYLVNTLKVTSHPRYQFHDGKPLVSIWGMGLVDGGTNQHPPTDPAVAAQIINWFKSTGGATVMGGVPEGWRDLTGSSSPNPAWTQTYKAYDVIQPWTPGRYKTISDADRWKTTRLGPDIAQTNQNNQLYMPVIFPGMSFYNNNGSPLNSAPRLKGAFLWTQAYNAKSAGATMLKIAMFDEVNEGTAMFKLAARRQDAPDQGVWCTLDIDGYDLPSDWYLRLGGEITRIFHGLSPLTGTLPANPGPGPMSPVQASFTVRNTKSGGNFLRSIATGPAGLVAVGDGGLILTSSDGSAWTRQSSGVTDGLVGVTSGGGQYVAVGDRGRILTSPDGAAWTAVTPPATTARLNNVVYGGGQYVAVGEAGAILTSPDARTWTARTSGVSTWLRGLIYVPTGFYSINLSGGFYASGQNGVLLRSPTGEAWLSQKPGYLAWAKDLEALAPLGANFFAAIGQDGLVVYDVGYTLYSKTTGSNGLPVGSPLYAVSTSSVGVSARFRGLAQGANALFATGENGVIVAAPHPALRWARLDSGTTSDLVAGVFAGDSLFVVGANETILQSTPLYRSRLINISTRGQVGPGDNTLISGLVVTGAAPKTLLMRAAGPALVNFDVGGTLAAPVLTVFDSAGRPVAGNTGWGANTNPAAIASAAAQVGAFAFAAGSADSALLATLNPGSYTAQVSSRAGVAGVALVEAYDADGLGSEGSRAINISTRGPVGNGDSALIAGFNIGGAAARRVLVRAVGPTLGAFGVTGTLAEPVIEIYRGGSSSPTFLAQGSWSQQTNADEIRGAAFLAGAFALAEDSKDVALVVTLAPGSWTAKVSGRNNSTGVMLIEVYDLP